MMREHRDQMCTGMDTRCRGEQFMSDGVSAVDRVLYGTVHGPISHIQDPTDISGSPTMWKAWDSFGQSVWYMNTVLSLFPWDVNLGQ